MNKRIKLPTTGCYGDYSSNNYGRNCQYVEIGALTLYYSYETVVAFEDAGKLTITENVWAQTTGKHLNWINRDKSIRIPYRQFVNRLEDVMEKYNLVVNEITRYGCF